MSTDQRIFIAGAVIVGIAVGYAVRAQLDMPQLPPPPPVHSASPPPPPPPPPAPSAAPIDSAATQAAFDEVYKKATWGTNGGDAGTSGFGSTMQATAVYRSFLEQFMKDGKIKSVVDAGCGDWESTQAIDWKGIDYKGYDIVDAVIAHDKKQFEKPNIHFFTADIVEADLPAADLLIVKQVLQHLPNASVAKFLGQLPKFKHVLIMNSVSPRTFSGDNKDIKPGEFRPLDITRPPFNVPAAKVLTYWDGGNMQQLVYLAGTH